VQLVLGLTIVVFGRIGPGMKIRIATLALGLAALVPALTFAHETAITKTGMLVDVLCAKGMTEGDTAKHTRECGLMAECVKSGYGIFFDGKFHPFDAEGNKQAEAIFRSTSKTDHIAVTVEGTLLHEGDIRVTKLTPQ